jgi:ankyrin repeat protein
LKEVVMVFVVEPLPPRPNFEQQQKLAKRLLRDVWDGRAEALERVRAFHPRPPVPDAMKLHDAQLVIARGYGFANWAAMKQRIEQLTLSPLELFDIAVRAGDAERARSILAADAGVRAQIDAPRFDFDSPAIHQAKKHLPLVDVLLEYGADINARSSFWAGSFGILEWNLTLEEARPLIERGAKLTPWAAAMFGLLPDLQRMVREAPELVHARGGDGKTLLHFASTPEIAEFLMDAGADLDALDVDHRATPLQHLIGDEKLARCLLARGATADIFAAARLGDVELIEQCLQRHPDHANARVNSTGFTAPGGHIYGWTLGFDMTPVDVARKFGHGQAERYLLARMSTKARYLDALWHGDGVGLREIRTAHPEIKNELDDHERRAMTIAAWWYRPAAVRLMLEEGFDPHLPGVHRSTPLDRAAFHGYVDIVRMLLEHDPAPPLEFTNEFGGTPLSACIYGSLNGWETGYPRDHAQTVKVLLEAGAKLDPTIVPTGNDEIDTVLRDWLKR